MYIRYLFFSRKQLPSEKFDSFLTDIKFMAKDCEFGKLQNDLARNSIVCEILKKDSHKLLLCDSDLTLKKVIDKCLAIEVSTNQFKSINEQTSILAVTYNGGLKNKNPTSQYQNLSHFVQ